MMSVVTQAQAAPTKPRNLATSSARRTSARITVEMALYAAMVVVALALRLIFLADKPLHHDESLHATFTWYLFTGHGYHYDPMMHGPFQILVTAVIFFLFGASDFTTRLLPVVFGSAIVALPFFLRRELGRIGALAAAVVLMLSPSFLYFSRFYRDDIYIAFFTLGLVACYWRFLRTQDPKAFMGIFALGALSFASKENTYITVFIFGLWILLTLAWELSASHRRLLLPALQSLSRQTVALSVGVFVVIFAFFFTTAFTWWPGLLDGVTKSITYWLSQQPVARGGEPWWYYFSLLLPYEPLVCGLAIGGTTLALRRLSAFDLFLVWYAVLSLIVYSWAGEKMPWLILHPLLPLVLLAARAVETLWQQARTLPVVIAWIAIAVGTIYMVHATVLLSYYDAADPREMLVYTQTSPDVLTAMHQIRLVGLRTDQGKSVPIMIDPQDWWPFVWYLRNYTSISSQVPTTSSVNVPIIIVSDQNINRVAPLLHANYLEEHFKLRWWWLVDWQKQSAQNWWNWLMYRKNWNPRGSTDFYLFIRRDLSIGLQ
ncbi:MAG: TIGR03663 family protein [Chloroflexi bacterium]|nr:TIGR03663 family protein [Chloroflexota bacterium]